MERITIENFGPITKAEITLRNINIYIGTTSSGKSTVAKLISIFKGKSLREDASYKQFVRQLSNYNIDFQINNDTLIRYEDGNLYYEVRGQTLDCSQVETGKSSADPIYIPAERVFFSMISQSIFGLINSNISLPKWLIDFGARFEKARSSIKQLSIDFLQADYEYFNGTDYIELPNAAKIKLSQASSGLQSVIPLLLIIQANTETNQGSEGLFVIEEPELNLYPSSQKDLIEFIINRINSSGDSLIVTTHSPYLLTTIDNLIQAKNALGHINDHDPHIRDKVEELIPSALWVDYDRVSCYYFDNGTCRSTLDEELHSIGPSNIDDVSAGLSETFEKLLSLKYL